MMDGRKGQDFQMRVYLYNNKRTIHIFGQLHRLLILTRCDH